MIGGIYIVGEGGINVVRGVIYVEGIVSCICSELMDDCRRMWWKWYEGSKFDRIEI